MKGDVPAFLVKIAERARRARVVRQVCGKQYPVPKWQLELWEKEHAEQLRAEARRNPRFGARLHFRKIFRTTPA
jgi:hypothetical protein